MSTRVGVRIALLRQRTGFTQEDFAQLLGCTRFTVLRWESGKYSPTPAMFLKLLNLEMRLATIGRVEWDTGLLSAVLATLPLPMQPVVLKSLAEWAASKVERHQEPKNGNTPALVRGERR